MYYTFHSKRRPFPLCPPIPPSLPSPFLCAPHVCLPFLPFLSPSLSYVYSLFGTSGQLTIGPVALVSLFMSETFTKLGIPLNSKDKVRKEDWKEGGRKEY